MILFNYLDSLMIIFNYLNSLIFYSLVLITVGFIGFSIYYSINNINNNVTDNIVDTSSNNVNSDEGTQTEDPSSSVATTNSQQFIQPVHEEKYRELLALLSTDMKKRGIDELCLRLMIYKYPEEDLYSINFNRKIIIRFCVHLFFKNFERSNMFFL